ncbi:MAG: UDP-N-acetylmuramoyl-L-alanyl-D-glutamate--2,6-diaminopimelate ligase [Candidatus Omnitrophota bacterium]
MKLRTLFPNLDKIPNPEIKQIHCDSSLISKGDLFVAIKGTEADGHKFIKHAILNGAVAVVREKNNQISKKMKTSGVTFIDVADTRKTLSGLAARFYDFPSEKLKVIGITGTNGKTTVSYLVESILEQAGLPTGLIGTIDYKFKHLILPSINTTPGPLETQSFLSKMLKEKIRYCVMEVSSHALSQGRVRDVNFDTAVFTNLTQDHLDYHHNLKDYFETKANLFKNLKSNSWAVINNDDLYVRKVSKITAAKIIRFGLSRSCEIRASNIRPNLSGSEFQVNAPKKKFMIKTSLIGRHNVYNILAAIAVGFTQELDLDIIRKGIERLYCVPGRLESIHLGQKFQLLVDYAHTEDALKNVLTSLKEFNRGRLIVVFGCGGERDKTKRPKMGKVVSRLANHFILTNDNPRRENPLKIIQDITKGIKTKKYEIIPNRYKAIEKAISLAKDNDTILIAGKGHETYQILKDRVLPFDDRKIVRKILRCLK